MAVHRRVAAAANWCIAAVAAASLLLVPVTTTAGTAHEHPHALVQVVVDLADGSYDHHGHGHGHGHGHDDGEGHTGRPGGNPAHEPAHAVRPSHDHAGGYDHGTPPARGRTVTADEVAGGIDAFPVVTAFSPMVIAGAMPLAQPSSRLDAPPLVVALLLWAAVAVPSGVALDPLSPPPRAGSPA